MSSKNDKEEIAKEGLDNKNVDSEGFLRRLSDWSEDVAQELANQDGIKLSEEHWEVINVIRAYYAQYKISPITRTLVKVLKRELGDKVSSVYLMQLFSSKPAKLVSKIAGLPKPSNCD
ncbi:MAG: TusE/DsrC/DsvC family sulfur relay protein [Pseudomonadales bacterium]|nr:TusE/DsrC/DsvC family sulfur relay protein [Pseudomonadales bacterium]